MFVSGLSLVYFRASDCSLPYSRGEQILQKSRKRLKILGARWVTWSRFHSEGPQILCVTIHNLVARVNWRPGFVHMVTMYVHTSELIWNPTSKTLEPDRPQHGSPTDSVVAQQYSSSTFVSLRLHYRKKSVRVWKCFFPTFVLNYLNLKLCNCKVRTSGSVCRSVLHLFHVRFISSSLRLITS